MRAQRRLELQFENFTLELLRSLFGLALKLLDVGRSTLDRAKRKQIYDQVQRLMAEDPISLPLYSPDLLYAMQKTVKGFQAHPTGFYYGLRFAWLER